MSVKAREKWEGASCERLARLNPKQTFFFFLMAQADLASQANHRGESSALGALRTHAFRHGTLPGCPFIT